MLNRSLDLVSLLNRGVQQQARRRERKDQQIFVTCGISKDAPTQLPFHCFT